MAHHVLLLGGYGKVAQLLTPLLLKRSWTVTSIIRDPAQVPALQGLANGHPGTLNVLVRSLEDVKSDSQAQAVIDEVKPNYIVWSAGISTCPLSQPNGWMVGLTQTGAGGKGDPSRVGSTLLSSFIGQP